MMLRANRTVSLQLVMNVLQWIVLSHCIYRVHVSIFIHCWATAESLKMFRGPGKSWKSPGIFVSKRVGTLYNSISLLIIDFDLVQYTE